MAETFYYGVNNRPDRFEASVNSAEAGGYQASTTAMGWSFEGAGETAEGALEALKESMVKAGWFLHKQFSKKS